MDKKKIIIGVSAALLVVGGIFAYRKFFKKGDNTNVDKTYRATYTGDYIQQNGATNAVHIKNRPAFGTIVAGDNVEILGDVPFKGVHKVLNVWKDGAGNIGAIYVPKFMDVAAGTQDKSFNGKYTINLI